MEVNELANLYREKFPAGTRITDNRIATFLTPVYERFRRQAPNAAAAGRRLWEIVDRAIPRTYDKDAVKRIMNNKRLQALRQARNNRHANNERAPEANGNFAVNNVEDANDDNNSSSFEEEEDSVIEDDDSVDDSNAEDDSVVEDGNGEEDANGAEDSSIADNSEDATGEGDCHSVADDLNGNNSNTEDVSVVEDGHGEEDNSIADNSSIAYDSEDTNGADDSFNSDVAVVFSSVQLMEDIQAHEWNLGDEVDLQPTPGWIGNTPLQQDPMDPGDIYGTVNPYNIGFSVDGFTK
jgi:hypothetical protein